MNNLNKLDIDLNVNTTDLILELTQVRDLLIEIKSLIESISIHCIRNEADIDTVVERLNNRLHQSLSDNFSNSDSGEKRIKQLRKEE